ncbi:GNAT family N-acetyltransferase [Pseudonocardia nematodicida]|uniref:GNAT family N-acetyltransferase n=1 Tax=Pseudonocardia nematodicida TaxID=1206997 RepID=UPI003609C5FD
MYWAATGRRRGRGVDLACRRRPAIAWLEVEPGHCGAGLGRFMLRAGLERVQRAGAEQAVLYVSDDEPGTACDRTAATALYRRYGFLPIDRLHTFTRSWPADHRLGGFQKVRELGGRQQRR